MKPMWMLLTLAVATPALAAPRFTVKRLEAKVTEELLREGTSLERLGYELTLEQTSSDKWVVSLSHGSDEPLVRMLPRLPDDLEAAAGQVVAVVANLLRSVPAAKEKPAEEPVGAGNTTGGLGLRGSAYELAAIRDANEVRFQSTFWGMRAYTPWSIFVGDRQVTHYEFAKLVAASSGEAVDPKVQQFYEPENRRMRGLVIAGWIVGGVATGVGGFMALVSSASSDYCYDDQTGEEIDCGPNTGRRMGLAVGGAGLAVMLTTAIYQGMTTSAEPEDKPFYERQQAEALVDSYNRRVRNGVPPPKKGDDDDVQVRRMQHLLEEPASEITVALAPNSFGLRVTF
jgi:hypothetical protein